MILLLGYGSPDNIVAEIGVVEAKLLITHSIDQSQCSQVVLHNPAGKYPKDHISMWTQRESYDSRLVKAHKQCFQEFIYLIFITTQPREYHQVTGTEARSFYVR